MQEAPTRTPAGSLLTGPGVQLSLPGSLHECPWTWASVGTLQQPSAFKEQEAGGQRGCWVLCVGNEGGLSSPQAAPGKRLIAGKGKIT